MRSFILTADDFGRSPEVNAAIERWHKAGALQRAGLMINERSVDEAREISRRNPSLRVGLHLTLCDGLASDGSQLPPTPFQAGMLYAFNPKRRAWLREEIESQFARFVAMGFPPHYWDGHTHLHLHPLVLSLTLPIAAKYGFRHTRLVREPGLPGLLPWIFSMLSKRALPLLKQNDIGAADAVFGLRKSGRMDAVEFERALRDAPDGVTEIYFHPGAESLLPKPEWVAEKFAGKPPAFQ